MNDFEHVDRYLAQAAEETEHPFGNTEWVAGEYLSTASRLIHGIPVVLVPRADDAPPSGSVILRRDHSGWREAKREGMKSGVSELAARLSSLYLEGTEEDEP